MAFIQRKAKTNHHEDCALKFRTPNELLRLALDNGIETEPVLDVVQLARYLKIEVNFIPLEGDDSGCLEYKKKSKSWHMKVNALHHPNRQRFTIAHEIGHYIEHGNIQLQFKDTAYFRNGESNKMEAEANSFASELLMPADKFNDFVKNKSQKISDIAEYFQVSAMAVRVRAKVLGYKGHDL